MVAIKVSRFRENIYQLLDQVIQTGIPVELERKGVRLKIVSESKQESIPQWIRRDVIVGNPEDLVHMDWSSEWNSDSP